MGAPPSDRDDVHRGSRICGFHVHSLFVRNPPRQIAWRLRPERFIDEGVTMAFMRNDSELDSFAQRTGVRKSSDGLATNVLAHAKPGMIDPTKTSIRASILEIRCDLRQGDSSV
jgi:hypothetical protein